VLGHWLFLFDLFWILKQYSPRMKIKQVVVVTKLHFHDLRKTTKHIHKETLKEVIHLLESLDVRFRVVDRNKLKNPLKTDLIITVGGDGTVLAASHFAGSALLFGINSAPQTSTGYFCHANPKNFKRRLKEIFSGKRKPVELPRLEIRISGVKLPYCALNDMLFACRLQGETARYQIRIGLKKEEQKSSGVWVATGAGSTAALYSAGGKKDSPFSKRIQYFVREPFHYPKNNYHLVKGFLRPGQKVTITSEMRSGMIFIDGGKLYFHVPRYAKVTARGGVRPLKIFL